MLGRLRAPVAPPLFSRIAWIALGALTLIVVTGAAVRLTGSGLGCPDWPKCFGNAVPPLKTHAVIEFGNRMLTGVVGFVALAAALLAWRRRPFRRDLLVLGALLPLGVVAQAVLGGFTVTHRLAPGFVMAHFALSMLILVPAFALAWRARERREDEPRRLPDRRAVAIVRGLVPLAAVTIVAGTVATAAGPHAGGRGTHDLVHRLRFKGSGTLDFVIHQHALLATLLGLAAIGAWLLARQRGAGEELTTPLTTVVVLLGAQGIVGAVQYSLKLPTEIVWVHVGLATLTWIAVLWSTAAAGSLALRTADRQGPAAAGLESA
ncbi:MAG TPA: COX15/CtaA family protein [Solirubrobacteraceae bacterium]|nr:COX15/CtaA family protein [Solirubrobacteraceae bacterium]